MTAPVPALPVLLAALVLQPQIVFFLIIGVMWLFKAISRAKAAFLGEQRPQQEADRPKSAEKAGPVEASLSAEERALLVRQDILKKRAQRQAEAAAFMGVPSERQAPAPPPLVRTAPTQAAAKPAAAAGYTGALPRAPVFATPVGLLAPAVPVPSAGSLWLDELRGRDSARRAILVREILGQPVALR